MSSKIVIGGLLAATAIGVTIGLLLSSSTSKETKEKLRKGAGKLADSLASREGFKDTINQGVDQLANKGKKFIDSTSERIKV